MNKHVFLFPICFLFNNLTSFVHAWLPPMKKIHADRTHCLRIDKHTIHFGQQQGDVESDDFQKRMAVVRSLQMSYYKPTTAAVKKTNGNETTLNERRSSLRENGQLQDLPLFRAPWWEVPGRSNVLNIHEPIYTNMFEKILYGPKPWCFGHLYLEDGSRNLKSEEPRFQLESWETTEHHESAVLGCLMNISDYRRLADGRLLLLVHALERFVVMDVIEKLPYGICNAQILPDAEEIDPDVDFGRDCKEDDFAVARALAIEESVRYHDYEYDPNHRLPMTNKPDMQISDITGSDIAKVLPFCPFAKEMDPPEPNFSIDLPSLNSTDRTETAPNEKLNMETCLEYKLLCQGIYHTPLSDPDFENRCHLTVDELEFELWIAINNFLIETQTPVSPVLLGLLPIHLDIWQDSVPTLPVEIPVSASASASATLLNATESQMPSRPFALKKIVRDLVELDSLEHDFVSVSADYPAHRRQRRLSYSAAHLLEANSDVANSLRPKLLSTPNTKQRLRMVLEKFDQWQERKWGEFQ